MPSWKHKDIFPSIQEAIEKICKRTTEATHDEIIDALLADPEACSVIDHALLERLDRDRHFIAAEMIAWLSQVHTMRPGSLSGNFGYRFDKRRTGHRAFTYFLAK